MSNVLTDSDKDLIVDLEDEYRALVRSLEWTKGFGLLFVVCSPAESERLIARIRKDIPQKSMETLRFTEPIESLIQIVDNLPDRDKINILFIKGIEYSLNEYIKPGYGGQGNYYNLDSVPRILGHLNLQRERFRDKFNICFVFMLPKFALKFFILRAPDFFDWRSGVFEFPTDKILFRSAQINKKTERLGTATTMRFSLKSGGFEDILQLTPKERQNRIFYFQSLLDDETSVDQNFESSARKAELFFEQGLLLVANEDYENAINRFIEVIKIKPDTYEAYYNLAKSLSLLGRHEEAISNYDQVLKIEPQDHKAWYHRGNSLYQLGRYKEAIGSYYRSLTMEPNNYAGWYNLGNTLYELGDYELANMIYNRALGIKPDLSEELSRVSQSSGKIRSLYREPKKTFIFPMKRINE